MTNPLRLGALISGTGRTLANLADRIDAGALNASIEIVISSRASAPGVDMARRRGLEVRVAARRDVASDEALHDRITAWLTEAGVELVCLCGYLRWFRLDPPLRDRVINIHPALLPAFGGQGMHGMAVHRAVLEAGCRESGCTVHVVDDKYDHGPVILQRRCPVKPGDDAETLAARVFECECEAYPEAIAAIGSGKVRIEGGRVARD